MTALQPRIVPVTRNNEWVEPAGRFLRPAAPPVPALPLDDVFSPDIATWVRDSAETKSAPADYVVGTLLSAAAAMVGGGRSVAVWPGWGEPCAVWSMLVGDPSAGKSPSADAVLGPLTRAEAEAQAAAKPEIERWAERADIAKLAEETWKADVRQALAAGHPAPGKPAAVDPGAKPALPTWRTDDATIEGMSHLLAVHHRGLLLFRDELAGWLEDMTRYSSASARPFWIETFGGRPRPVHRATKDPILIPRMLVSICGGIQGERLSELLVKTTDDGLLSRFLIFAPEPVPPARPKATPDPEFARRILLRLRSLKMAEDPTTGAGVPLVIPFSPEARDVMDRVRSDASVAPAGIGALLKSHLGKAPGLTARLALVLALLDWAAGGSDDDHGPSVVEAEHVGRAALFVNEYAFPMARRAYGDAGAPADECAARRLLDLIRDEGLHQFTVKQIADRQRAGLRDRRALAAAISVLAEADAVRVERKESGPRGGKPSSVVLVNPAILRGGV